MTAFGLFSLGNKEPFVLGMDLESLKIMESIAASEFLAESQKSAKTAKKLSASQRLLSASARNKPDATRLLACFPALRRFQYRREKEETRSALSIQLSYK
jgi:hypothetical protein